MDGTVVFVAVVAARLLVPLAIPRYPLPGILAALVIDAVDQTVFQHFGGLPADYQSYDKALDVYYLVVAYAATLRNWRDPFAFGIARALWYYRLVGTVAYEATKWGPLLLIFPNTFEYFFIAYEAVRVAWDPRRMGHRTLLLLAAAIWVVIKLPQEWWIHVANLDVTDEVAAHPTVALVVLFAVLVILAVAVPLVARRVPPPDWAPTVDADAHRPAFDIAGPAASAVRSLPFWASCAEKTVLLSLMLAVFASVLDARTTPTQLVVTVALVVVGNAAISQLIARRGTAWSSTLTQFLALCAVNVGLVLVLHLVSPNVDARADPENTLFFLLLSSLIITLYDRYRTMRERRRHVANELAASQRVPRLTRGRAAPTRG